MLGLDNLSHIIKHLIWLTPADPICSEERLKAQSYMSIGAVNSHIMALLLSLCPTMTLWIIMGKVWLFHSFVWGKKKKKRMSEAPCLTLNKQKQSWTIMGALSKLSLDLLENLLKCEDKQIKKSILLESPNISSGQLQPLVLRASHFVS